jgi:hypothetical protein
MKDAIFLIFELLIAIARLIGPGECRVTEKGRGVAGQAG